MTAKYLVKAAVQAPLRTVLERLTKATHSGGKPFPFGVSHLRSGMTLNCCVAYNKYGGYCVPVSGLHRPAAQTILAGSVWEAGTIEFITGHCGGGDIVHAGTFFGDFLPALGAAAASDAKVWAFEPHPESYRCAAITIELNGLTSIELTNAGLGDHLAFHTLVTHDFSGVPLGGSSQVAPAAGDNWQPRGRSSIPIQIVTIDDIVPQSRAISIIHLDVEGYEERCLFGALRTIRQYRPIIIVESVPGADWMSENLLPLGYGVLENIPPNTILACR